MKLVTLSKVVLASTLVLSLQSCDTQTISVNNKGVGVNAIKQLLTSTTNKSFSILENSESFLTNSLIDAAMPSQLKQINSTLENLGFNSLVEKEKKYIADAASTSVTVAKPIIASAIQDITLTDAISIVKGGKGAGVEYLKNKTQDKLIAAIQPKVEQQLNANGITSLIENATGNNSKIQNTLNLIIGNKNTTSAQSLKNSISKYASEQIVNGMFDIAKDYEVNQSNISSKIINSVLNGN